jgi:site-specific recombinase XerD
MNKQLALEALERAELLKNHSSTTRESYRRVIADYLDMLARREISNFQGYLDHLRADRQISSSGVWKALNAGVFFCREVLKKEAPVFKMPPKGGGKRVPVYLSHRECLAIFDRLERVPSLQCRLMYGCGLRVTEMCQLRLKDLDFESGMLTIRGGKGDKDRTVRLPRSLVPELMEQVRRCRFLHEKDKAAGRICPIDNPSLMRKLGRATFGRLEWYYLFPSRVTRGEERWHATPHGVAKALKDAAEGAGIIKRVSPHVFRHSYATNLLQSGTDIRTLQDQLGHSNVETTKIYTHAVGFRGTESPLDKLGAVAPTNIHHLRLSRSA